MNRLFLSLLAAVCLFGQSIVAHADGYTYQEIVVPGAPSNIVTGIAADGTISGAYPGSDGFTHGFLLRDGHVQTVNFPGAANTSLNHLNSSGSFVGTWYSADHRTVGHFVGDRRGNFAPLQLPFTYWEFDGINASGVIAGTGYGPENDWVGTPFLVRDGVATPLVTPVGPDGAWLGGFNARGAITGYIWDDNYENTHMFLLDGGQTTWINIPDSITPIPSGINDHNQVVGVYQSQDFNIHGFVYDGGRFASIDYPAPPPPTGFTAFNTSWTTGINNRGQVVGYLDAFGVNFDTGEYYDFQISYLATPK